MASLAVLWAGLAVVSESQGSPDEMARCQGVATTIRNTEGNDRVEGTPGPDVINAGPGDNIVFGRGGRDRICGGPGVDRLRGGRGNDVVFGGCADCYDPGPVGFQLVAGGPGRDELFGSGEMDRLVGGRGGDVLQGRGSLHAPQGEDLLEGGPGVDLIRGGRRTRFVGGPGDDRIEADGVSHIMPGAGDDVIRGPVQGNGMLDLSGAPGPVTIDIPAGVATGDGTDTFVNIFKVTGSDHNDRLIGDSFPNTLAGGDGIDVIEAGEGDDRLRGGLGDDLLDGGQGIDTLDLNDAPSPVVVDLYLRTAQGHGNDELIAIENVIGSVFDDSIAGDDGVNLLQGGGFGGLDEIAGRGGDDVLQLQGAGGHADGGPGDDALRADVSADGARLDGGEGDDILTSSYHNDVLDGGPGRDTAEYDNGTFSAQPGGVRVDLAIGTSSGYLGDDTLVAIEDLFGSPRSDVLRGDDGPNRLEGRYNNDELYGLGGDDTLIGRNDPGGERDYADGGEGTDTCILFERRVSCERGDATRRRRAGR